MNVTPTQILSTYQLNEQYPLLFSGTMLSFGDGTHIGVFSQPNADQAACQQVLLDIFPEGYFSGSHLVDSEGSLTENFKLVDLSGAYITLYMKKEPGKTVWTTGEILRQEGLI